MIYNAVEDLLQDMDNSADIFTFSSDQLPRLVNAGVVYLEQPAQNGASFNFNSGYSNFGVGCSNANILKKIIKIE